MIRLFQTLLACLLTLGLSTVPSRAQNKTEPAIRLQFQALTAGQTISPHTGALTRLDFLLSQLELQDTTGHWIASDEWFAAIRLQQGQTHADTIGSPAGEFQAIRFRIGVPEAIDRGDPAQWPAGHPLHPDVNGLHWGWQGGYIHLACEGRSPRGAYSYHLAGQENPMIVELPVRFHGGGPVTLRIDLDLDRMLSPTNEPDAPNSTHSRPGDTFASQLKETVRTSFKVRGISYDLFQSTNLAAAASHTAPSGTHPYPLEITRRFPQIKLPDDNPLTQEGVALGEKLFHDPILSVNHTQSCSSCHQQDAGLADPRRVSLGAHGQPGKRNAMALVNLAWSNQGLFWDGRASTLRQQVLMPITDPTEMGDTLENVIAKLHAHPGYLADFQKAFHSPPSPESLAKALEQFLLTRISQNSRFDQAARKQASLTDEEKRGLALFVTESDPARGLRGADCFHCHGGTLFTDHTFHNNGLSLEDSDTGRMAITGLTSDRGKFRTPSLRNIALTAPYMHDGRFATLEEVIDHYNQGIVPSDTLDPNLAKHPSGGLNLSEADKKALVAFLKTLTDTTSDRQPSPQRP